MVIICHAVFFCIMRQYTTPSGAMYITFEPVVLKANCNTTQTKEKLAFARLPADL